MMVKHKQLDKAWDKLEYMFNNFDHLKDYQRGLTIHAPTGSGKTYLLKRFMHAHPVQILEEQTLRPVVYALVRTTTVKAFLDAILAGFGITGMKGSIEAKIDQIVTLVKVCKTHLILIDEANLIAEFGKEKSARKTANLIKSLINIEVVDPDFKPCIVLVGVDTILRLHEFNDEFLERFRTTICLNEWDIDELESVKDFTKFTREYTAQFGIHIPDTEYGADLVMALFISTHGRIRNLERLVEYVQNEKLFRNEKTLQQSFAKAFISCLYETCPASRNPFLKSYSGGLLNKKGEPYATYTA